MSLFNRPSEPLGQIGEKVPEGFVRADELMEFALPARWGEGFLERAIETLPVGIPPSEKLRGAVDNGRAIGVAQDIREALDSGALRGWEFRRRSKKEWYPPERIPSSDWSAVDVSSIVDVLLTRTGDPTEQSMLGWRDQPVIAFRINGAESWLDSLEPAMFLPPSEALRTVELPHDNVSLSAALSWRAGQTAEHWIDVQSMGASIREAAATLEAYPNDYSPRPEFDAHCFDLTDRLAAKLRRNRAALDLLHLMANGRLKARGIKSPGHRRLEKIKKSEFAVRREIVAFEDMLIPGKSTDSTEQGIAIGEGTWKHVRFLTGDLLEAFRGSEASVQSQETSAAKVQDRDSMVRPRPRSSDAKVAIKDLIQEVGDGPRPMSAADAEKWLRTEFNLTRDVARAMWSDRTPKAWRQRGAPKKYREK